MCEGCVDICPWKCIHMVKPEAIVEATGTERPATTRRTRWCSRSTTTSAPLRLCVDRCPTGVIILGKAGTPGVTGDTHTRTNNHGYAYGMRF